MFVINIYKYVFIQQVFIADSRLGFELKCKKGVVLLLQWKDNLDVSNKYGSLLEYSIFL